MRASSAPCPLRVRTSEMPVNVCQSILPGAERGRMQTWRFSQLCFDFYSSTFTRDIDAYQIAAL
jgi:hypothetical protein